MRHARNILFEAAVVALAGLVFALAANALSPRGLHLRTDYFPGGARPSQVEPPQKMASAPAKGLAGKGEGALEKTLLRLQQHGLQTIASNEVVALFRDSRYEQGTWLLVDARDDAHYQAGHIPGAWQFDHYHADQYMTTILPLCLAAQKVVVYCNGGACEDSEFAAVVLREAGVPAASLFVYAGGISEWKSTGQPVETGGRRSGQFLKANL
jgi:rhodanese-related sulfurtransferase